ncbi:response regulator GlrR [Candidatus Tenderia electrophaga]|jgi:two-component system response regulator GlrR|uniref:Response regulator GlrR n=1 Tax=Candidatus Tenderia electrophaga TaxID=1748243 RepID=A0A0S2TBL7_9GAMM|nr:response regulator GlrR [Candidatus Tenderia electrophaga]
MMNAAKVMIVDDDPSLLRLLSMRLEAAGYEPVCASSGEQALAKLPVSRPQVVITDLRMGGMNGMALFGEIHERNPSMPVIMLTAHGSIPDAVAATSRGVFGFLTKPFDSKQLLDMVKQAASFGGEQSSEAPQDEWCREIVTRSSAMDELLSQAHLIARSDVSVFIHGESGTGKELLARAIHRASPRADKPFIAVNCSAIPEQLLESELFGHRKGAFTGATHDHKGLFQAAHGGTLFLDEIGDMPPAFQSKLLRVLQEHQVRPVGSVESIPIDVRMISATHRDLEQATQEGEFREDLYYRLNVVALEMPALAERREDIPLLANHFLHKLRGKEAKKAKSFSPEAVALLVQAAWPGNVRQLYNVVEQAVVLTTSAVIPAQLVQRALRSKGNEILPFAEARQRFERDYLTKLLRTTNGNVTQAARLAQRNRTEFYKLLNKHHLAPALFKE